MTMIDTVRPVLEPEEQVAFVFVGQTGLKPSLRWITGWLVVANQPRIIVVTDRRVVMFKGGRWRHARPSSSVPVANLPRNTRLEHGKKSWSKVQVGDKKVWLSRKLYPLIDNANAAVAFDDRGRARL